MELKLDNYLQMLLNQVSFNRTLWNWNVFLLPRLLSVLQLLIVPYGIETFVGDGGRHSAFALLIVPYGIETTQLPCIQRPTELLIVPYGIETYEGLIDIWDTLLLIVPYGIETMPMTVKSANKSLLIVPYGIETDLTITYLSSHKSFNRTLWNWNSKTDP